MKKEEKKLAKSCIFYEPLDKLQIGGVDMDKKFFSKLSNFFKKEGFYVILFFCLCIVASVAIITARTNKTVKNNPAAVTKNHSQASNKTVAKSDEQQINYNNALEVEKEHQRKNLVVSNENPNAQKSSTAVTTSNTINTKFIKPVEGTLARAYSEDPVKWDSYDTTVFRPNLGIDIKTDLGKPVYAVLNGVVEKVDKSEDGIEVVIDHQNGLKTVYANLDEKVNVKAGQNVKQGDVIGKVGNTTLRAAYEKYGYHLHFAVISGKDYVDPAKYIKY